jgi:hypothetical protein
MRALALSVALAFVATGCDGSETHAPTASETRRPQQGTPARDVAFRRMPARAAQVCQSLGGVKDVCPSLLPKANTYSAREIERSGLGYVTFNMEAGTSYADTSRDRPPSFAHVVLEGGDLEASLDVLVFSRRQLVVARDGLLDSPERRRALSKNPPRTLYLGKRNWAGRNGELVLAPPYDSVASIHGGHLLFAWSERGMDYAVSLHAWEPFTETERSLRLVVESIP